jgi:deazaflavin-dependent oxidoreductase (nitroreductase family)
MSGLPVVMLTTTGARSGLPRTVPVLGFPIEGDIAVAAGNFGRPEDPGWCVNLRREAHARLVVGGRPRQVIAEELTGAARERVWDRAIEIYPGAAHTNGARAPGQSWSSSCVRSAADDGRREASDVGFPTLAAPAAHFRLIGPLESLVVRVRLHVRMETEDASHRLLRHGKRSAPSIPPR